MSATTHGRDCRDDPCEDCRLAVPPTDTYLAARRARQPEGDPNE